MKYKRSHLSVFVLKFGLFLGLLIVFYVYYAQEVLRKYTNKRVWLATTREKLNAGIEPPISTLCLAGPFAKKSVLKKYNMSASALNEPSISEQRILKNLNKTLQDFYKEATFELKRDFELYMEYDDYGIE